VRQLHHIRHKPFLCLHIFHTVEFLIVLGALAAFWNNPAFSGVFWGSLAHMAIDFGHTLYHRVFFKRAISIVDYWVRSNRLRKKGVRYHEPYYNAFRDLAAFHSGAFQETGCPK